MRMDWVMALGVPGYFIPAVLPCQEKSVCAFGVGGAVIFVACFPGCVGMGLGRAACWDFVGGLVGFLLGYCWRGENTG